MPPKKKKTKGTLTEEEVDKKRKRLEDIYHNKNFNQLDEKEKHGNEFLTHLKNKYGNDKILDEPPAHNFPIHTYPG